MRTNSRAISEVRAESRFATPPRLLVVAADNRTGDAVALAEALEHQGAEIEVRFAGDMSTDDHVQPDAVIVAEPTMREEKERYYAPGSHPLFVAITDGDVRNAQARAAGFDLVVSRAVSAKSLMDQLGDRLPRIHI